MRRFAPVVLGLSIVGITLQISAGAQRAVTPQPAVPPQSKAAKRFVGTWRLVSIESNPPSPTNGARPTGLLYYDSTGHMGAQIMPDRPRAAWTGAPTPEQAREAVNGYTAYFGTYTVDEEAETVTHHRHGTLVGGYVNGVLAYEFLSGDRMVLIPLNTKTRMTWERIK